MTDNRPGVVFHLDEASPEKQRGVAGNIEHLMVELADGSPIELVAHGEGLSIALRGSPMESDVRRLLEQGVVIAACHNTMRSKGVGPDRLIEGVHIVPAGVAELVRRQRDGWAYVRP